MKLRVQVIAEKGELPNNIDEVVLSDNDLTIEPGVRWDEVCQLIRNWWNEGKEAKREAWWNW